MDDAESIIREATDLLDNLRMKDAAYNIVNIIKSTSTANPIKGRTRKLTTHELDDIIEVIDIFPVRIKELGVAIRDRQRQIIRFKMASKDVIDHPNIVERLKAKLRSYWYRGIIPGGTPLGYRVADDSAAAVMQGTLNTRHKPGSKQNASGGIQNQREVLMLSMRSIPVVVVGFTDRQTFRSIMEYWRPKWTGTTLQILTTGFGNRGYEIIHTPFGWRCPDWWGHFRKYFNLEEIPEEVTIDDFPINSVTSEVTESIDINIVPIVRTKRIVRRNYILQYRLNRRLLLAYGVTLTKVRDAILESLTKSHSNAVAVYFSPLSHEDVFVHIVPDPKEVFAFEQPGMSGELAFFEEYRQVWSTAHISGMRGVKTVTPLPKRVIDAVRNEKIEGPVTILHLNRNIERFYGVGIPEVQRLVRACGMTIESDSPTRVLRGNERSRVFIRDTTTLVVKIRTPIFDPLSWLQRRVSIKSFYGNIHQTIEGNDWLLECKDESTSIAVSGYFVSKGIATITTTSSTKFRIARLDAPKISVLKEIRAIQLIDQEIRTQLEEERRNKRIIDNTDNTILSPITTIIEDASLSYTAEVNGGDLRTFLLEEGINPYITYSNDAREMNRTFGIRAAHNFLTLEIDETWSNSGAPLQPITIATLVSVMTYSGSLTPSSFTGITSVKMGFLAKMSVHAAQKWLSLGAVNAESDPILSVASAQMVGKRNRTGTGSVEIAERVARDFVSEATIEAPLKDVEPVIREYVVASDD